MFLYSVIVRSVFKLYIILKNVLQVIFLLSRNQSWVEMEVNKSLLECHACRVMFSQTY